MTEDKQKLIKRLTFENYIWVIFIIISILDIYGDELIKKYLRENDQEADRKAKKIFFSIIIVSLIIYLYFLIRNYSDLQTHPNDDAYQVRLFGSIFIFVGTLCLFYFQMKTANPIEGLSNV